MESEAMIEIKAVLPAPAKLNLFLHITGKRADGYHNLQTVFAFLDICDYVMLETDRTGEITLEKEIPGVPREQNLLYRAAAALAPYRKDKSCGVRLGVEKNLPMGGGIGGGSSDAATVLAALNVMWGINLGEDELADLAVKIGADVPVFVRMKSAFAEGVGEILSPLPVKEQPCILVMPDAHAPTKELFANPLLRRDYPKIASDEWFMGYGENCFERVVTSLYPVVGEAIKLLSRHSPARMTGSGSCVFALFDAEEQMREACDFMKSNGFECHPGRMLAESPLRRALAKISERIE